MASSPKMGWKTALCHKWSDAVHSGEVMEIKYTECSCEKCRSMCHAPCCGTPEDMRRLIEAGYGKRLMFDNLPGGEDMVKPALKGYEGTASPWEVASKEGCTFWKDGKCELHSLGLKPEQAKLVIHGMSDHQYQEIGDYINESWQNDKGADVIKLWEEINDEKKNINYSD